MIDNRTAPYAALVLRLALSFFFFAHLIRKFAVIGFDPWWAGLVKQGYPGVVLGYTVAIEFAGALTAAPRSLHPLCQFAFAPRAHCGRQSLDGAQGLLVRRWRHGISACLGVHADRTGSAR
jgi:hypothetical protein